MLGKVAEWIVAGALFDKFVAFAVGVALVELASIL